MAVESTFQLDVSLLLLLQSRDELSVGPVRIFGHHCGCLDRMLLLLLEMTVTLAGCRGAYIVGPHHIKLAEGA